MLAKQQVVHLSLAALLFSLSSCQNYIRNLCELVECSPENFIVESAQTSSIRIGEAAQLQAKIPVFSGQSGVTFMFEQHKKMNGMPAFPRFYYDSKNTTGTDVFSINIGPTDLSDKGFVTGPACLSVSGVGGEAGFGKKKVIIVGPFSWKQESTYTDADAVANDKYPWPVWAGIQADGTVVTVNDGRTTDWSRATKIFQYGNTSGSISPSLILNPKAVRNLAPQPDTLPCARLVTSPTDSASQRLVIAEPFSLSYSNARLFDCPPNQTGAFNSPPSNCQQVTRDITDPTLLLPPKLSSLVAERVVLNGKITQTTLLYYDDGSGNIYSNTYTDSTSNLSHQSAKKKATPAGSSSKLFLSVGNLGSDCPHCLVVIYLDILDMNYKTMTYVISDQDGSLTSTGETLPAQLNKALSNNKSPVTAMALGDLDANGISELAIARQSLTQAGLSIIRQTSSQGWQLDNADTQLQFTTTSTSSKIEWITVGDVNQDGKLDLVAAIPNDKQIRFFLNQSDRADPIPCQ